MSLTLINEVWDVIRPTIHPTDINEAAESLVTYLVDHEYDPEEIKKTFKRDSAISTAINYYLESPENDFSKSKYDEDDEDNDNEYDYEEYDDDLDDEWE